MRFRMAEFKDADIISEMELELFPENWMSPHTILAELEAGYAVLAEDDSGVFGYTLCNFKRDTSDILRVGVLSRGRGKGVGTELVKRSFIGASLYILTVDPRNHHALNIYRKLGFHLHGVLLGGNWVLTSPRIYPANRNEDTSALCLRSLSNAHSTQDGI